MHWLDDDLQMWPYLYNKVNAGDSIWEKTNKEAEPTNKSSGGHIRALRGIGHEIIFIEQRHTLLQVHIH